MQTQAHSLQPHSEAGVAARLTQLQVRVAGKLQLGWRSQTTRYGLRRDLDLPFEKPAAKIPITVRPMVASDLDSLLALDGQTSPSEKLEIAWRRAFVDKGARQGFVAVDARDGTPCYMQWLLSDNRFIRQLGGFPDLEPGEALLENAYTPVKYRGMGIMSAAMALIAEEGIAIGARYVLTFVDQNNIASLKGCQKAGFYPHMLHHRVQFGFGTVKTDRFEKFADDDPRRNLRF